MFHQTLEKSSVEVYMIHDKQRLQAKLQPPSFKTVDLFKDHPFGWTKLGFKNFFIGSKDINILNLSDQIPDFYFCHVLVRF